MLISEGIAFYISLNRKYINIDKDTPIISI
jgi:hypothetical protein